MVLFFLVLWVLTFAVKGSFQALSRLRFREAAAEVPARSAA